MATTEALSAYRHLYRNLLRSNQKSKLLQLQDEHKKEMARLTYQKINAVKQQTPEGRALLLKLNKRLDVLKKQGDFSKSKELLFYSSGSLRDMLKKIEFDARTLEHVRELGDFLHNQKTYGELIERYNPGMRMSQEEKVKKTANTVGLQVPEDK